ncbi:hypothetical protein [Halochromatium roseum]|nr:hypothetical protein [Halochromatium roseum]
MTGHLGLQRLQALATTLYQGDEPSLYAAFDREMIEARKEIAAFIQRQSL